MPKEFKPTWVEKKIIEARLTGTSFGQMSDDEIRVCVDKMILNCSAIVGCGLPQTDYFADILTDAVKTYLVDYGYEILTNTEVMLAMNLNEKRGIRLVSGLELESVAFSGNHFNVSYLAKVIQNYLVIRGQLDRKLQNHIDGFE
ncbi:MAG TPA: hypothetical protein PKV73_01335 [Agriterribacter sp.]|nr:hypothetical protein [Agriterribacter sp.]